MPFDIESARRDGASDSQIKDFLGTYFDTDAAIRDGATLEQLAAAFQAPPPTYTPELEAGILGLPVAELQQREAEVKRQEELAAAPKIDITPDWEKRIAEAPPLPPKRELVDVRGFKVHEAPPTSIAPSAPGLGVKTPIPPAEPELLRTDRAKRAAYLATGRPLQEVVAEYRPEPMKLDFEGAPIEEKPEPAALETKPAAEPEKETPVEAPGTWKSVKGVLTAGTASWLKSGAMVGHELNKALWITVSSVNAGINDSFGTDLPTKITPPTADENPVYKFLSDVEAKNNIIEQRFGNETASSLIQKGEIAEAGKLLTLETLQSIPLLVGFAASAALKIPMLVPGAVLGVSRMGESQEEYLKRVIGGEKLPDETIADFAAFGKGAVETVFMTVGMGGIFNRLALAFKATSAAVGKEAAEKMVSGVLVNMSKHALGEGRNAAATMLGMTMGQNLIDKVTGVNPGLTWNQMVRNGIDATLAGFAMGMVPGAIRGVPEGLVSRGVRKAAEVAGLLPKPRERHSLKDLKLTASEYVDAVERDPSKYVFEDLHEGDKGVVVEEVKNRRRDADAKAEAAKAKAAEEAKTAVPPPPAPAAPAAPEAPKIAEAPKAEERPATPPVPPPAPPPAPAVTPKEGEAAVPPKRVAKKPEELTPDEVEELVNSDPMSPEAIKAVAAMAPTIPDESRPAVKKEKVEIKKKKQKTEAQKEREVLKDEAEKQNYRDAVALGYKPRTAEERMAVFTLKTPEEAQAMNALVREIDKAEANREMWEPQQLAAVIKKYEDAGFDSKIDDFGVKQKVDGIRQQLHDDGYTKSGQSYEVRDYLAQKKVFTQVGIAVEGEGGYMTAEKVKRRVFVADENELKQMARNQIQARRRDVAARGGVSKKKSISEADIAREVEKIRADNIVVTDSELQARARATLTARKEKITEAAIRKEVKRLRDEQQDLEWESEDDARREITNKNEEAARRRAEMKRDNPDGDMEEVSADDWNSLMADLKKVLPNTDVGQWRLSRRNRLVVGAPRPRPSTAVGRAPEIVSKVTATVLEDYFGHYKPENLDIVLDTEGRLPPDAQAEIFMGADGRARVTISSRLPASELRRILVHEIAGHFGASPLIRSDPRIHDVIKRLFEEDRKYFQDTPLNRITEELKSKYKENWLKSKELRDYIERVQVFHTYRDATPDVLMDEWIAKQIERYDARSYTKANVTVKGMIRAFFKRLLQRFGLTEYTRTEEIDAIIRDVLGRLKNKNEREKATTRYAREGGGPTAPTFYSVLKRAFENAPARFDNLKGKQWIQWLDSNKGKLGIKQDEIEWSGIKEFLELVDEAPVERNTIIEYLDGKYDKDKIGPGVPKPEETTMLAVRKMDIPWEGPADGERSFTDPLGNLWQTRPSDFEPTKLRLNFNGRMVDILPQETIDNYIRERNYPGTVPQYMSPLWRLPGGENYGELAISLPGPELAAGPHYPEIKNVLAWIRFNERVDAEGKKVLFLEEIQSDWGQSYRKEGGKYDRIAIETAQATLKRAEERFAVAARELDAISEALKRGEKSDARKEFLARNEYHQAQNDVTDAADHFRELVSTGVSRGPFVTNTKAWVGLALKRAIRYAAERGMDRVAWTTGIQQVARWSKSMRSVLNGVRWGKYDNALAAGPGIEHPRLLAVKKVILDTKRSGEVRVYVDSEGKILDSSSGNNEWIGKPLSELLSNKANAAEIMGKESGEITGKGLTVGGKGFIRFYDEMLPQVADDILRRLGGGKVGKINIPYEARGRAHEEGDFADKGVHENQPAFDITPAMRDKVLYEGQPLFAKEKPMPIDEAAKPAEEIPEQERVRRAEEHIYGRKGAEAPPPAGGALIPKPPPADPMSPEGAYESFTVAGEGIREWFKRKAVDEFARLGFVQKAIQQVRKIPEAFDAYLKQEIMHGKTKAMLDSFRVNYVLPLERAIHDSGMNVREIGIWLYARHAKERNASGAKINPVFAQKVLFNGIEQLNPSSGMFDVIADAIIKQMSVHPEKLAQLYKIEKMVKNINTYHEYVLQKYGLVSAETIKGWNRAWKNYVPLKGFQESEDAQMLGMKGLTAEQIKDLEAEFRPIGGAKGFSVSYKPKTAMGRETMANADNIIANILTQIQKDIITAHRNEVGRAFLGLVMESPNNKVWEIVTEPPRVRVVDSRGGGQVRNVVDPNWKRASNVVVVKVNGEDNIIRINDDALANAMKNMGTTNDSTFAKIVRTAGAYNRFLAGMITRWSPEFIISNFQRDLQEAMINITSEHSAAMAAQIAFGVPRMMKGMYGHLFKEKDVAGKWILKMIGESGITDAQKWAREFSEHGGTVEFVNFNDLESVQKRFVSEINSMDKSAMNNLKKFVFGVKDFVDIMNSAVENGTRLSCFKVMREHGYSPERAAQVAKNLTVNFNRKGEWGATFNSLYMFANAAMQGNRRALQILKTPKGVAFTVGLGTMGVGFAEWGRMMMGDENYEKIPLFTRTRNWIIPKADGTYYKIPLPFNFGVFYATGVLFESMTRGVTKPEQATANILSNIVGSFNPLGSGNVAQTMFPTAIRWYEDYRLNTDFAGNPMYPERAMYEKWKPESQMYFKGVSAQSKAVAERLNQITGGSKYRPGMVDITPELFDYFIKQQVGGLGDFLMKGVSSGWKTAQYARGVPGAELPATREIPFWRRIKGAPLPNASKGMFYRKKDELQAYWEQYTDLAASDTEAAKAFLDQNQNEIMAYNLTRYVNTAMSNLNKIAKAARERGDTATEQKTIAQQTDFLNTWAAQMNKLGTGIIPKKKAPQAEVAPAGEGEQPFSIRNQ